MPTAIQTDLAFILFLPAFCIVGALYCLYPRTPRGALRWIADLAILALAAVASFIAMRWGFRTATGVGGALWRQVLATLLAFGFFFAVVGFAALVRSRLFRSRLLYSRRQSEGTRAASPGGKKPSRTH